MSDPFKKPIFIGKVGKLPKPLSQTAPPTPQEPVEPFENKFDESTTTEIPAPPEPKPETNKVGEPQINYKEPSWSGEPESKGADFEFDVLKSGQIIENVNLMSKNYWVFGRLPKCDVFLQHPTISRYHAVLQYNAVETESRSIGFYLYDLGSTHGTFLNKSRIKSKMYVKISVGHMIKFGNSTRSFILKGPEEDEEPESELTITELKQNRINEKKRREAEIEEMKAKEEEKRLKEIEQGIDWGMGEDADEESDLTENPYAMTANEELYLDDPKKTLRGYFEREGEELNYEVEERGIGQFICRVELPVENTNGRAIVAEAIVKGKKKEAVVQCALEACRILDRAGVLRQAKHESRKRKSKNWEEDDYCNSDDDEFFDRTGAVERKKQYRMKQTGAIKEAVETYDSLIVKEKELTKQISDTQIELDGAKFKLQQANEQKNDSVDSLDDFMKNLNDDVPDKKLISRLTLQLTKLRQDQINLVKLINIAKPSNIPTYAPIQPATKHTPQTKFPIIGKRLKLKATLPKDKSTSIVDNREAETIKEKEVATKNIDEAESSQELEKKELELQNPKFVSNSETISEKKDEVFVDNKGETSLEPKKKELGPQKPEFLSNSEFKAATSHKSQSRNRNRKRNDNQYKKYEADDKYSTWLPPENQKGDGKTALNEKLGY